MQHSQVFATNAVTSRTQLPGDSDKVDQVSAALTTLTVTYDAPTKSYTLTTGNGSTTFGPEHMEPPEAGLINYSRDTDAESNSLMLTQAGHIYNLGVRYVGAGYWQQARSNASGGIEFAFDAFTYGIQTPDSAIRRTGAAGYAVNLLGFAANPGDDLRILAGEGVFSVEFASGNFSAEGGSFDEDILGSGSRLAVWSAAGTLKSGANGFEGTFRYSGYGPTSNGSIEGRFYGPDAQELGAVFRVSNAEGGMAVGALIGARDNDARPIASTVLPVWSDRYYFGSHGHTGLVTKADNAKVEGPAFSLDTDSMLDFSGEQVTAIPAHIDDKAPRTIFTAAHISPELSNDRYTVYRKTEGTTDYQLTLAVPGPGNPEIPLTYTSFGVWERSLQVAEGRQDDKLWMIYGVMTNSGAMGRTGTASYNLQIKGSGYQLDQQAGYDLSGNGSLQIDLASQKYAGNLAPTGSEVGGSRTLAFTPLSFSGNLASESYVFESALHTGADHTRPENGVGQINGWVFGPRGEEFGSSFGFKTRDATDATTGTFSGVAFGKRD